MQTAIISLKIMKMCLTTVLFVLLNGCIYASEDTENCTGESLDYFLGYYKVTSIEKYRGGLTSEAEAKLKLNSLLAIKRSNVAMDDTVIKTPVFEFRCVPISKEGEIPSEKFSDFFGLAIEREMIDLLEISQQESQNKRTYIQFEIVESELWFLYDGWLYIYTKTHLQ